MPALQSAWDGLWPCYSCCKHVWIPSRATFGPHCAGLVAHVPSWIALATVILCYVLSPIWRRRPLWLRKFAAEEDLQPPSKAPKPWSRTLTGLLALFVVGLVIGLSPFVVVGLDAVSTMLLVPCLTSCLVLILERPRSTPSTLLTIQASLFLVQLLLSLAAPQLLRGWQGLVWLAEMAVSLLALSIILKMPMRHPDLESAGIAKPFTAPTSNLRSPEDIVTLWQWLTVSWMAPLISLGRTRRLDDGDVWFLPFEFQHSRLHDLFQDVKGSVTGRLLKVNGLDLLIVCGLGSLESVAYISEVVFLKQLLSALESDGGGTRVAVAYAVLSLIGRWIAAQSGVLSLWFGRRAYERSRGEMITMIYEKTLRRKAFTFRSGHEPEKVVEEDSGSSTPTLQNDDPTETDPLLPTNTTPKLSLLQRILTFLRRVDRKTGTPGPSMPSKTPASTGKILNLMRGDVYEVSQRFWEFASLITKPLNLILSLTLLWRYLGPASLLGIAILVAVQIVNAFILRGLIRNERARRVVTDTKLQLTNQFVEAIRHLRWYDWQDSWLRQILESRQAELNKRLVTNFLGKAFGNMNSLASYLFPVAGFFGYTVITGKPLTVEVAFPALDLFSLLETSLRELPQLVTVLLNAHVAMGRIEAFMAEPNKEGEDDNHSRELPVPLENLCIELHGATFSWPGSDKEVLRHVTLSCRPGLSVVCGEVGIGKTALIHAILGELDQSGGEKKTPDEMMGYCAQTPWLQSMSIRENVLFSTEYEEHRYKQVLDACCLLPDLGNLKAGDLTMVGENGIGLSGGQRARVALARAVYSRARVLLLDDPIAALDHQTAETILRKLFANKEGSSLMGGRLVVFVTHRVDIVTPYADQVVDVLKGGHVRIISRAELESSEELQHLAEVAPLQQEAVENEATPDENSAIPDKFTEEEYRAHGGVMASVYWRYVKAGGLRWWAVTISFFVMFRVAKVLYFWFLKKWGEAYDTTEAASRLNVYSQWNSDREGSQWQPATYAENSSAWYDFDLGLPNPGSNVKPWLVWFLVLSMAQVVAYSLPDVGIVIIVYKAGKKIFGEVMQRVSNATFRFYDVTPVGRLMNRLTSDIGTMDGQIANQLIMVAWSGIGWVTSVVVIAAATPLFLILTLLMTAVFVAIFMRFLPTSQSLRRLEMTSLSPLMTNFGTLLEGLTTVRAFKAQPHFQRRIVETTDNFQKNDHFYWSLQAWLMYRFDTLSAFATFAMTATALASGLPAGSTAFILAAAGNFVVSTHSLCRMYGEMQMQFVSVERVIELLDLEQEAKGDICPPASWPGYDDDIEFRNVTLRYAPSLDPSLVDVSFRVPAGSTVAVTGRTGSGKSTLALALLGTVLPDRGVGEDGSAILIGGIDVARADKRALRRAVSFVAQDPVLFPGTVRDNLDPIREHSDEACEQVLKRVFGNSPGGVELESRVDAGGKNLSQGQRQLVGLGRAILRRSPVVILDEATASIDVKTAFHIQEVLRDELSRSTVITIAHRVEAVKDADYRLVLEKGRILEAGPISK